MMAIFHTQTHFANVRVSITLALERLTDWYWHYLGQLKCRVVKLRFAGNCIFYTLTFCTMIALLSALLVAHQLSVSLQTSLKTHLVWSTIHNRVTSLRHLAGDVAATANDVFETSDTNLQLKRFDVSATGFKTLLADLEADIRTKLPPDSSHDLMRVLSAAGDELQALITHNHASFDLYAQGQNGAVFLELRAARRYHGELVSQLDAATEALREVEERQNVGLRGEVDGSNGLIYLFYLAIALLFCAFTVYSLRVVDELQNRDSELELLTFDFEQRIAVHTLELSKANDKLDLALESMDHGLVLFGPDGQPLAMNRRLLDLANRAHKIAPAEMTFRALLGAIGLSQSDADEPMLGVDAHLPTESKSAHHEHAISDGRVYITDLKSVSNACFLATIKDVTQERRALAEIESLANKDSLTGLANRTAFQLELAKTIRDSCGSAKTALLCLDLNRFTSVNDSLGHAVGDELLKQVAQRIKGRVRSTDVIARLGGDEFAVIQSDTRITENAGIVAARLIEAMAVPFEVGGNIIQLGANVGIALAPDDSLDGGELMKMSEIALHKAKTDGKNTHQFFETGMDQLVRNQRVLEHDLRFAAANNAFELHYQPLLDLTTDAIVGFEALIRWRHPERGLVSPLDFIPLAEELGLIGQIGAWVMKQACVDAVTWPSQMSVAVNLSADQFNPKTLPGEVISALEGSGLSSNRLELEITESIVLEDTTVVLDLLHQLKSIGVRISMDDFGTGYSSLAYLHKFPFDKIKIDRSFVDRIDIKPASLAIVRAVMSMSRSLGISTTGEGVETIQELQCLRAEGCTQAQGYLISKPVLAAAIPELITLQQGRKLAA
jgi:diguanylate cyclase (GGDEF)-like protein